MVKKNVFAENLLLTGTDSGNRANKVSFMNNDGNIESFTIPTIVAPTSIATPVDIETANSMDIPGEETLHLKIESPSMNSHNRISYWFVGEFAKNRDNVGQPDGRTEDKYGNEKHIVTTLAGIATAAFKRGLSEVKAPFSGGLPIEEYKKVREKLFESLKGTHVVEAISGKFKGNKVTIHIEEGTVNVEGVTNYLALNFDIQQGQMVKIPTTSFTLGERFAIADLGAGTNDYAHYTEKGLDDALSTNDNDGTNQYIDQMIEKVKYESQAFDSIRSVVDVERDFPYKTRESFIKEIIEPAVKTYIENEKKGSVQEVKFIASWGRKRDQDITEDLLPIFEAYSSNIRKHLDSYWARTNVKHFIVVGGGLLFAYPFLADLKSDFIFPPNVQDAPYFTSRAYLLSSFATQMQKLAVK